MHISDWSSYVCSSDLPGESQHSVEPALDPASLHVLLGHPLVAAELLAQCADDVLGDTSGLQRVDALAVVVDRLAVALVVAQLLADGFPLTPERALAPLPVDALPEAFGVLPPQLALALGRAPCRERSRSYV